MRDHGGNLLGVLRIELGSPTQLSNCLLDLSHRVQHIPQVEPHAVIVRLQTLRFAGVLERVWEDEPTPVDNPLLNLENVVCSSHVAGVTREANRQMAVQVAGEMLRVLRGEKPEVLVNPEVWGHLGRR